MNEWISVKDRLPEEEFDVLIYSKFGITDVGFYNDHDGMWFAGLHSDIPVTHWMPLPEPPE